MNPSNLFSAKILENSLEDFWSARCRVWKTD